MLLLIAIHPKLIIFSHHRVRIHIVLYAHSLWLFESKPAPLNFDGESLKITLLHDPVYRFCISSCCSNTAAHGILRLPQSTPCCVFFVLYRTL